MIPAAQRAKSPHKRARAARTVIGLLLVVAMAACGGGPKERASGGLEPTFEPVDDAADGSTSTGDATSTSEAPTTIVLGGTDAVPDPGSTSTTVVPTTEAAIADAAGDATPSPVDPAPAWSDLLGARLSRARSGFELRVRLAGGDAPEDSGSADHTMNVASFYDVDGDGGIDFEIWANLADGGWDTSYFDNRSDDAAFGEATSFVTVATEGDEVVLRFALSHLDRAERFRWSVASEWGRYEAIASPAMVRDEAPDDDAAASFPG